MTHQGDVGGSTNSITWLTRGLAERGHDVYLACRPESLIRRRFETGRVHCVDAQWSRGLKLMGEAPWWRRWIAEHEIDVVNAHASLDRHVVSYVKLLGTAASIVHTRRNLARTTGGRIRASFDRRTTDAIIAVSGEVGEDLIRRGVPREHVHVVRNGLPLSEVPVADPSDVARLRAELNLRDEVPVIGVVARRKSQEDLLVAAKSLGFDVDILFVGIESDDELARLSSALPGASRAIFLGFRDDVAALSALFDVFVLPSEIEGFSLALLEAMARGLPCIATDAGGNREALGDGAGIIVPSRDPDALAKALISVVRSADGGSDMGTRARRRALSEFDVSRTIARTEALYERLRSEPAR
jgi:glycosyltransferase involved in cell wall biosynthesis